MVELYSNGTQNGSRIEFQQWKFPGGEIGVKINIDSIPNDMVFASVKITGLHNLEDIMVALQLHDAMTRIKPNILMNLAIAYYPYARQDRVCHPGEAHSLEVFTKMLCCVDWCVIGIVDPHSRVTEEIIQEHHTQRPLIVDQYQTLMQIIDQYNLEYDMFIAPDAGAKRKMQVLELDKELDIFSMQKARTLEGLSHSALDSDVLSGKLLVVDDICDGGATFISVAKRIQENQPRVTGLDLYVTHGIFSKGIDELLKYYDNVYCFNNMSTDPVVKAKVQSRKI